MTDQFDNSNDFSELQRITQQQIDSNARAIAAGSAESERLRASIDVLAEASGRFLRSLEIVRETQEEHKQELEQHKLEFRETIERIDRALDYLIRRDINRGPGNP